MPGTKKPIHGRYAQLLLQHRDYVDLCILIIVSINPAVFSKILIFVEFLGFSVYRTIWPGK